MAAIALHHVLEQNNFDHTLFGGYQLQLMGNIRGTKDVDVVVKKPMFNGFEKVKQAFADDPEFMVFDGNCTDGIRAIHSPSGAGVDSKRHSNVLIGILHNSHIVDDNRDPPKGKIGLPDDPNQLPFFPAMHMFIKKIECLSVQYKESDEADIIFLFDNFELDQKKISKKVPASQRPSEMKP